MLPAATRKSVSHLQDEWVKAALRMGVISSDKGTEQRTHYEKASCAMLNQK